MTSPSVDFFYNLYSKFLSGCHGNGNFGAKIRFLVTKLKNLYLRNHMKYLGAFNGKSFLGYPGGFLVTFVYNNFYLYDTFLVGKYAFRG